MYPAFIETPGALDLMGELFNKHRDDMEMEGSDDYMALAMALAKSRFPWLD